MSQYCELGFEPSSICLPQKVFGEDNIVTFLNCEILNYYTG